MFAVGNCCIQTAPSSKQVVPGHVAVAVKVHDYDDDYVKVNHHDPCRGVQSTIFSSRSSPGEAYRPVVDGQGASRTRYHALSVDRFDAEDLGPGPHQGTYATQESDGHGRGKRGIVRARPAPGAAIELTITQTKYLVTGEPTELTQRHGSETVTRTMQYDTLGRMVVNTEPSSSAGGKAWRCAYNNAGDLVGTSDALGCGVNFAYDAGGRLLNEDYSPCDPVHREAYGAAPEVAYRYDLPDDDAAVVGDQIATLGRMTSVTDLASKTVSHWDMLGRVTHVAKKVASPGGSLATEQSMVVGGGIGAILGYGWMRTLGASGRWGAVGAASAGFNGAVAGARGVYDWEGGTGFVAFGLDSTWGLLGTTLGNAAVVANGASGGVLQDEWSYRQNRQIYREGTGLAVGGFASTFGNAIVGADSDDVRHESVHVWQSRLYGPLFQLGWLGGVVGGGAVGAGYGLISGENVGHAAMTSGYYSHPFEESAYQAEGSYPSDHAEDWGLVPGMMRW